MQKVFVARALISVLTVGAACGASLYTIQWLGDLPGGADNSMAFDVDDAGQVVGSSGAASGTRAFLRIP